MASLQRKFQREIQERLSTRKRRSLGSVLGKSDDKCEKMEIQPSLIGLAATWPSPEPGNFKRSFRHSVSEKKLKSTITQGAASFKRRSSFSKVKQPLVTLRGSIRGKLRDSRRRSMMKGKQDYSARSSINGLVDFCRFMTAQDSKTDLSLMDARRQELEAKIEHEVKMHDGCAKLMAASRRPAQKLEAAKNLITCNTRIQACMSEMQLLKARAERATGAAQQKRAACGGVVSVSDIRVPLIWKDSDKDHRKYSAFCLFRVGTNIQATTMVSDIHKYDTDICINDTISFNDVPPEFELQVDVYCHKQESEVAVHKTPKKLKRHLNEISNTFGRSMGRRLSAIGGASSSSSKSGATDEDDMAMVLGPKFELIARGSLGLEEVGGGVASHDLRVEETTSHEVSLYGHFCCRLSALPNCVSQEVDAGMLLMKTRKDHAWTQYWCTLKDQVLSGWKGSNEVEFLPPAVSIPVQSHLVVSLSDESTRDGVRCFHIHGASGKVKYTCGSENEEDLLRWFHGLQQLIYDQACWQHACNKPLQKGRGMGAHTRSRSKVFREEPSFSVDSPMTRMLNRLNMSN